MYKTIVALHFFLIVLTVAPVAGALPCSWDPPENQTDDCRIHRTDHFEIEYANRNKRAASTLFDVVDSHLKGFGKRMGNMEGVTASPPIRIIVAPDSEAFAAVQLSPHAPIEWAAGIAYSKQNLIILSLQSDHFFALFEIARHEISHVALYRATGQHMPRWFNEGLAILHAGEHILERIQLTDNAFLSDSLFPFEELNAFPQDPQSIQLAYGQSARFVRYLDRTHLLSTHLPLLLSHIREGKSFKDAFVKALGLSLNEAEAGWHTELDEGTSWLSNLVDMNWIWVFAGLLFLLAYVVVRLRNGHRLRQMAEEENEESEDEPWPPHPLPGAPTPLPMTYEEPSDTPSEH